MTYYFNLSDDWVSYRAPAPTHYETVSTYTPWWYDDYEDEDEEGSLGNPILWGVGGLILGALLMGIVALLIRKRSKNQYPEKVKDAPDRADLLRKREQVAKSQPGDDGFLSNAAIPQAGISGLPGAEARSAEVWVAEAIPGETMPMLATRLQGFLGHEGVAVEMKDIGKILASYACNNSVRIAEIRENEPTLLRKATRALSEFFCVTVPGGPEVATDYLPADNSVPKHVRIEIKMSRLAQAERKPYGGINRETFRGILRETEEETFLPEEEWKKVDALISHYTGTWFMPERHLVIRNIENITSCLMAIGVDPYEATDYALHQALFLRIYRKISRSGMVVMGEAFNEQFQGREMPLCHAFLSEYMPMPVETETSETKNQTIHGGEYEPV